MKGGGSEMGADEARPMKGGECGLGTGSDRVDGLAAGSQRKRVERAAKAAASVGAI